MEEQRAIAADEEPLNMFIYNFIYYINAGHNVDVSNPYTEGVE